MSATVEIEIPPRREYVGVVRLALGALGRARSMEEEALDDLRIAVSEACANAVVASEAAGCDEAIRVSWDLRAEGTVVDVYDPSPQQSSGEPEGEPSRLELSLSLLRSLVDDIEAESLPGGGRHTRLILHHP